jgi:hypothetical protein
MGKSIQHSLVDPGQKIGIWRPSWSKIFLRREIQIDSKHEKEVEYVFHRKSTDNKDGFFRTRKWDI